MKSAAGLPIARAAVRVPRVRALHASARHFDVPRSPFQVFVETLRAELVKSREFQDNLKQLQGQSEKFQDSETMRKAREAYERARIISSIKHNPRLQAAAEQLRKSGGQINAAIGATLRQMEDSELMRSLSAMSSRLRRQIEDSTAPVRNTEVYKAFAETISEALDDGSSAIDIRLAQGTSAADARRIKREMRLRKIGRSPPVGDVDAEPVDPIVAAAAAAGEAAGREAAGDEGTTEHATPEVKPTAPRRLGGYAVQSRRVLENTEAGGHLVLAPESAQASRWDRFKQESPIMRRLAEWHEQYQDSEHPFIERLRGVTNRVASWFEENETAQVVRAFKEMDPSFTLAGFSVELREYVIPEVLDAYHGAQRHLLRQWCGEATYNVLMATLDPYLQRGYVADGRILDLSGIEIVQGKILETGPLPVLVISFQTQELMYFKDPKTGEVVDGSIEQANQCRYAMVLTRVPEEVENEITGGWKIIELARRGQAAFM